MIPGVNFEKPKKKTTLEILKNETKILDAGGNPLLMHNRSSTDFEVFERGKRNLSQKKGVNDLGFFFSDREDLEHYGPFKKSRYLNIKNPWDIRDLGYFTEYKNIRNKLIELGISTKDLAPLDLSVQDLNITRNKKLGSYDGFTGRPDKNDTRMATFNFFDAGGGYYLRRLLQKKGFDGIIFADEGELTAIAFESEQIIDPEKI